MTDTRTVEFVLGIYALVMVGLIIWYLRSSEE